MTIAMQLRDPQMPEDGLQALTLEMMRTLNSETDSRAGLAQANAGQGTRGDGVAIGQIILTALTSGTVVALFGVLKAYFERKPSLEIDLKRSDGTAFTVKASQLGKDTVDETMALAREFLEVENG